MIKIVKQLVELEEKDCPSCHILYWITKAHGNRLRNSKETFYCPNGHSASFPGKTDVQKLKELKGEYDWLEKAHDNSIEREKKLENKIKGYKGQLAKKKKRISNKDKEQ